MCNSAELWEMMAIMGGMSEPGLFHDPQRQGAGESQTLCNTMGIQTESECKRVNICNSSMWPAAFPENARPRCCRTPTLSFLIMNKKMREKRQKPVWSLSNSTAMYEATSVEVRWGGRGEGEEGRKERERGWTLRASGPGVYSCPSRCAEALEAIFGHSLN